MVKHLTGLGLSTQGVVIRRDSIEKYALYFSEEFKILDDTEMWFRVSRKCNIKYCHKPMAYFRQGASSLSSRAGSMMDEAERIHSQNYYAFASNLNSEELREFRRGLADLYFRMGYYHRAYRALSRQYLWQSLGYTKTAVAMLALAKSFIPFYGRDA